MISKLEEIYNYTHPLTGRIYMRRKPLLIKLPFSFDLQMLMVILLRFQQLKPPGRRQVREMGRRQQGERRQR